MPKHIAILGAESSGKTQLTEELAEYYKGDAVFEYAREYMYSDKISAEELEHVALTQFKRENFIINNSSSEYIFFDTEMVNLKVWFDYEFGEVPVWLAQINLKERYNLYLITANDLPWEEDPLRSMPTIEDREKLKERYIAEVKSADIDYRLIDGTGEERLTKAIESINIWAKS